MEGQSDLAGASIWARVGDGIGIVVRGLAWTW